ncbi:vacuolar protein sorting-associated protein 73 [Diutina catenulata]
MAQLPANLVVTVALICLGALQAGYHMAELNSPEAVMSCKTSDPVDGVPYSSTWFGRNGYEQCIEMSTEQFGMATSIFSIGGLVGSFYAGSFADSFGRKPTSLGYSALFIVGSTLAGLANSYFSLLVGRFVSGVAAGAALVITPIYINEISPPAAKGLLGSMSQVSINLGILLTTSLAIMWCNDNDWRMLLLTAAVLALANGLVTWAWVPESPRWLASHDRVQDAVAVLHTVRAGDYDVARNEVTSWRDQGSPLLGATGGATKRVTVGQYLKQPQYYPSRLVATGILVFQQFNGINSIIFYGVSVLVSIFPSSAIAINCLIAVVNVVVTFVTAQFVDRLGRKPLLLTSAAMLGVSTAVMAVGIISSSAFLSVVGTFTYIVFFATGFGPIPFLLVGEVTQTEAKASAQSWGTSMNWIATFIVGFSFPIMKKAMGGSVYFVFTAVCALSYWFVYTKVPETKDKNSYEEVWGLQ